MNHSNDNEKESLSNDNRDPRQMFKLITDPWSVIGHTNEEDKEEVIESLVLEMVCGFMNSSTLPSACIYRVPKELSNLKERAYTPHLFPIGPLHINEKHLQSRVTQDIKKKYAYILAWRRSAFELTGEAETTSVNRIGKTGQLLRECYKEIGKLKQKAIDCYAEYVTDNLTAQMMLIDGCFILELLFRNYLHNNRREHDGEGAFDIQEEDDPHIVNKQTRATVQHDLLIMGNQLPFFVLQKLFELTVDKFQKKSPKRSLADYVRLFLGKKMSPEPDENANDCCLSICTWATNCCSPNAEECVLPIFYDTKEGSGNGDTKEERGSGKTIEEGGPSNTKEGGGPSDTKQEGGASDTKLEGSPGDTKQEGGPGDTNQEGVPGDMKKRDPEEHYYHILHVIHDHYLRFDPLKERGNHSSRLLIMPCATELDYAGVKFVAGASEDLFKVEFREKQRHCRWFHRAQFEIPQLTINYTTEPFLRNLIAFEQCSPKVSSYFTSYAFLMGLLINSEKDVQVLANAGIIHNYLATNQDAADVLNNLCQEVVLREFHFAKTCKEAKDYSEQCLPKNIAHVRRTYFASPWTFIAFCVGFIAFGIGVAQFILSFL